MSDHSINLHLLLQLSHLHQKADEKLFKETAKMRHCLHILLPDLTYTDIVLFSRYHINFSMLQI